MHFELCYLTDREKSTQTRLYADKDHPDCTLPCLKNDRECFSGQLKAPFQAILEPSELCLPLPTGTGSNDIRFPFPLIARTLLGLVIVRFDNGLEFGSVI